MEIPNEQILRLLRDRGDHDHVPQADQQLFNRVDPERHSDLLGQIGIDPGEMLDDSAGKLRL
ncbi:MAG: hypothetical protein ACR2OB_06325 [Solirubrobacteraceae bacterium]